MTVGNGHRIALSCTAILSAFGVSSGSSLLWTATNLLIFSIFISVWTLHDTDRSRLRLLIVHGITLAGLISMILHFQKSSIDAALVIVVLGIFNRYSLRQSRRDDLIIVGASSVLMAASSVITPGLVFAVILVLFVPSVLSAMLYGTILGLADKTKAKKQRSKYINSLARRPVPKLRGALTGWGLGLMVVGYVVVSFLPKQRFGYWLSPGGLLRFAGASSQMYLSGGSIDLQNDSETVLRVRGFKDPLEAEGLYARVYALDYFDGDMFTTSEGPRRLLRLRAENSRDQGSLQNQRWYNVQLVRMVPRNRPHPIAALGRDGPARVNLRYPNYLPSGSWVTPVAQASLHIEYKAKIHPPANIMWSEAIGDVESSLLQLPIGLDSQIRDLAVSLVEQRDTRKDKIESILKFFSKDYKYRLGAQSAVGAQALTDFLLKSKEGHCELFAAAVTVMLRIVGVPARVVTGYYGGGWNRAGQYLEFGRSDAHAWVEVLGKDGRLSWVDATPPELRQRRKQRFFAWFYEVWSNLESLWYIYVIDFDEGRRRETLGELYSLFSMKNWFSQAQSETQVSSWLNLLPRDRRFVFLLLLIVIFAAFVSRLVRKGPERNLIEAGKSLRVSLQKHSQKHSQKRLVDDLRPLSVLAKDQPEVWRKEAEDIVYLYESLRFGPLDQSKRALQVKDALKSIRVFCKRVGQS